MDILKYLFESYLDDDAKQIPTGTNIRKALSLAGFDEKNIHKECKNKRVLKNGAIAGYVLQKDGSWKWRIVKGPKKNYKKGGNPLGNGNQFVKLYNVTKSRRYKTYYGNRGCCVQRF